MARKKSTKQKTSQGSTNPAVTAQSPSSPGTKGTVDSKLVPTVEKKLYDDKVEHFQSITSMSSFTPFSFEELRLADYGELNKTKESSRTVFGLPTAHATPQAEDKEKYTQPLPAFSFGNKAEEKSQATPLTSASLSLTLVHRFTSPDWLATLRGHLAGASDLVTGGGEQQKGKKGTAKLFEKIINLDVGESLLFAPSAVLEGEEEEGKSKKLRVECVRFKTRKRLGEDGGQSVLAVER